MKSRNKEKEGQSWNKGVNEHTVRRLFILSSLEKETEQASLGFLVRVKNSRPIKKEMVCSRDFGDAVPG